MHFNQSLVRFIELMALELLLLLKGIKIKEISIFAL